MGISNFRLQVNFCLPLNSFVMNFCLHQLNFRLLQVCRLKSVDESSDIDKNLGIDIITDSVSKMGFNRIQNHATSSQKKALISWLAFFFFLVFTILSTAQHQIPVLSWEEYNLALLWHRNPYPAIQKKI